MRILVIDDTQIHLDAARQTLAGHDLVTCNNYDQAVKLLDREVEEEIAPAPYDVVLCDLLMPAGAEGQGHAGYQHVGTEMPVGFALSLHAVLTSGAKYVAVVTATNHHNHPASAMLDRLGDSYWDGSPPKFEINGVRVGYFHAPEIGIEGTVCKKCNGTKKDARENSCYTCGGSGLAQAKDWGRVLNVMLGNPDKKPDKK